MPIDLASLWDFRQPELSAQRFRDALEAASSEDALVLRTQIARTYGLRREFERARAILAELEPELATMEPGARAYHALESGRTHASAAHPPESQSEQTRALARTEFLRALQLAREAHRDDVAIDALHMLAFVDGAPADQLRWGQEALAVVEASSQPTAKRWEASLRNNIGCALHELGRFEEALAAFERAVVIREQGDDLGARRVAHWMVAWTLRSAGRIEEAIEIQLRLERDCEAAGAPDPHVFAELALLYRSEGDEARARRYEEQKRVHSA